MELKVQGWWLTASALFGLYFVPVVEEEKRSERELGKLGSEVSAKGLGESYTNWRIARETRYGCNRVGLRGEVTGPKKLVPFRIGTGDG